MGKPSVPILFFFSEGEQAQSGRSETQYIILFNFQRGCNELCLVSSNSLQKSRSNCLIFQIDFGFHVNYQILSLRTVASIVYPKMFKLLFGLINILTKNIHE